MIASIQKWLPLVTLHILFLTLPLIFTASADELFEFPKMLLVYAAAIVLAFSWILQTIHLQRIRLPKNPFMYVLLAFVTSQTLSTLFSINIHTSLFGYYSRFNGGLFSLLSYCIICMACLIWITKDNVWSLVRTVLIGSALAALYAFPEHFGHSPSCLLITGQFTADCWIQDVQTRVFGTLGQPNWLAALMVVVLPISLAALTRSLTGIFRSKTIVARQYISFSAWLLAFLLFAFVLIYTKSRSGIAGAAIALGLQTCGYMYFVLREKKTKLSQKISVIGMPLFLSIVFAVMILTIANPVRDKLEQLIHLPSLRQSQVANQLPATGTQLDTGGSESGDIRKVVWSGALKVWVRYPIFGSGVETFAYSYYKDRPKEHNMLSEWDFLYNKAHNEFLNYLATTGAFGLLTYTFLYGSFIALPLLWAYQEKDSSNANFQLSIACALIGLAVSNFFGFSTVAVSTLTFTLPALAAVFSGKVTIQSTELPFLGRKKIISQMAIAVALLIFGRMLFSVYNVYAVDVDYAQSKSLIDHQDVENGVALLQHVVDTSPNEPVYRDELAYTAARLSYALGSTGDSTSAARFAQAAIDHSDEVLTQNHVNVNFYKTRARIFTLLGQLSPVFYKQAIQTLNQARDLSPTDPKLTYNLALIAKAQSDTSAYEKALHDTLELRPIDVTAQLDLAKLYDDSKKVDDAKREYAQVLKLDPSNKVAKDRIATLSAVKKK